MILQREVAAIALEKQVSKTTIDKDWVLGHFIDAIFSLKELKDKLIFKGGTCLKKCYFPDYRFSEDLDFTATDQNFVLLQGHFEKITDIVTERTGMACSVISFRDLLYKDVKAGYEVIIKYWGADHPFNSPVPSIDRWQTSIKVEIILYEVLLFVPVKKKILHAYSDELTDNSYEVPCYCLEEVISEKIRALIQRKYTAPRDYYDIWYLINNCADLNNQKIVGAFKQKMFYKNLEFTGLDQLINAKNERILKQNWMNSLGHQIPREKLADHTIVIAELRKYFKQIFE